MLAVGYTMQPRGNVRAGPRGAARWGWRNCPCLAVNWVSGTPHPEPAPSLLRA